MSGIASKIWSTIVGWQTGRDASDGFARDKYEKRITDYNNHFDRKLTTSTGAYDEKKDAEKIKQRIGNAQEMTNAVRTHAQAVVCRSAPLSPALAANER